MKALLPAGADHHQPLIWKIMDGKEFTLVCRCEKVFVRNDFDKVFDAFYRHSRAAHAAEKRWQKVHVEV